MMNTGQWISVYLLLLIPASVFYNCSTFILPCGDDGYSGKNSYLYRQLENTLLNNPDALHALHTAFFELNRVPRKVARIELCLQINHMESTECTKIGSADGIKNISRNDDSQLHKYCWTFKWSSSAMLSQINTGEFLYLDPILTIILYDRFSTSFHRAANITLRVASLPCKVADDDILWTVTTFLTWIKAYARDEGRPITWRDEDRGYISLKYTFRITEGMSDSCKYDTDRSIRVSLLVGYISLNLLVPIFLAKCGINYYLKICRKIANNQTPMSVVCAVVIVTVVYNTFNFIIPMCIQLKQKREFTDVRGRSTTLYTEEIAAFITRIILIPFVYTLELLIAVRIPKDTGLPIPSAIRKLFFCCWCFSGSMQSKIIQTLAVWHIMIFIQSLAMSAIPVGVFLLINPLWLVSVLGSMACLTLFFIVILSYLLHSCITKQNDHKPPCKRCTITCLRLIGITLSCLFVFHLLTVYLTMVYRNCEGTFGFLASFLPPVILSITGWCLKNKINLQDSSYNIGNIQSPQGIVQMHPVNDDEPLLDIKTIS